MAPILEAAADLLLDRLDDTTRRFTRALDLGGRGVVAPRLRARGVAFVVSADLSPRIAPFPELRDGAGLLQRAGFALPVADAEELDLAWRTPFGLFAYLRAAGEGNAVLARDRRIPPRALFPQAAAALTPGPQGYTAPLRLLMLTGWAPHASQQQPARPGSATHRLADALGTVEHKAGDKAGG